VAYERIAAAEKAASGFPFAEYQKSIASDLQKADKENSLVYHVRVPESVTLGPIDKAVVAKPVAVNSPMSSNFTGERRSFLRQIRCNIRKRLLHQGCLVHMLYG